MKKRIDTARKGSTKEKLCADELIAMGYTQDKIKIKDKPIPLTWKVINVKWQNLDLFGLFDVCALAPDGSHLLFIQVKSNKCDTATRDAIRALKMPKACQKWIWIWKDQKGWVKEFYE